MMESRKNPDEMSAHERLDEIAAILFQALMRIKTSQKSNTHTM